MANFCSVSEPDNSGHFTVSPEADGRGESSIEFRDKRYRSSMKRKRVACHHRVLSSERNKLDGICTSTMSAQVEVLIAKCLEKSVNSPRNSDSDEDNQKGKIIKEELTSYPDTYLGEALRDFNSMFTDKLQNIDNVSRNADTQTKILMMERKNEVLEQWAKDVCSQNMLLVRTMEELEDEANHKVKMLQTEINSNNNSARSHMEMMLQYKKQAEELLKENSAVQNKYDILTYQHMEFSKTFEAVQQILKVLENDNDSLKTLVCRIRDTGIWDVNGLTLQTRTYDLLFGLYPNLAGSEVQTIFSREKAQNISDMEAKSKEMEKCITELRNAKRDTDDALDEREKAVVTLEAEVKSLSTMLIHYQNQCNDLKKILAETQEKLIQVTTISNQSSVEAKELLSGASKGDQDIKNLLNELQGLKAELNKARNERKKAISKSEILKRKLGDRTSEMLEMRKILENFQNEAKYTFSAAQNDPEKQDHLSILKDQIRSYQEKYEQAQTLLSSKSDIIESLQQQMSMLHEKVFHMGNQACSPIISFEKIEYCKANPADTATTANNLIPSSIDHSAPESLDLTSKETVVNMFEESGDKKEPEWITYFTKGSIHSSKHSSSVPKTKIADVKVNVKESTKKSKPTIKKRVSFEDKSAKKSQLSKTVNIIAKKAKKESINGLMNSTAKEIEHPNKGAGSKLPKTGLQNNHNRKNNSSPESFRSENKNLQRANGQNKRRSRSSPRIVTEKTKSGNDNDYHKSNGKRNRSKSSSTTITLSKSKLAVEKSMDVNSLHSPCWNPENILQLLPRESNEISVKNWIASSSKICFELNKKVKTREKFDY